MMLVKRNYSSPSVNRYYNNFFEDFFAGNLFDSDNYESVDWRELQKRSVQIWGYRLEALGIPEISDGIYEWNYPYDDFLGYMAGILPILECEQFHGSII